MRGDTFTPVPNRGMITISIMLANIMQGVDNTILNVALPHVQGSLSASLDQIAWALTSYIVCAAIMMPLTGWLAGRSASPWPLRCAVPPEVSVSSCSFVPCRAWPGPD
jgi:MFS family permease